MAIRTLTNSEFESFKESVKYWAEKLGASEWDFWFEFKRLKNKDAYAEYYVHETAGTIQIRLNKFPDITAPHNVDRIAFHEVFESVYIFELRSMAKGTYSNYEVDVATHRAVRRAENTIYNRMRGNQ